MGITNFIPKLIRQVINDVPQYLVTATRWNELWNLVIEQGDHNSDYLDLACKAIIANDIDAKALISNTDLSLRNLLTSDYYTRETLDPFLTGGDTEVLCEVFTIVNANNGDGTFTYNDGTDDIVGNLVAGAQVFILTKGTYIINKNRISVIIDDITHRSQISGGLEEIDETSFALDPAVTAGTEITVTYYERIGFAAEYQVIISPEDPPESVGAVLHFKILD